MLAILKEIGGSIRRSIENPATPLYGDDMYSWGSGSRSDSGIVVTRQSALSLAAVWRGVQLIANGCAKVGMHRYVRVGEQGRKRDKSHPTYNLVRSKPNEFMTAYIFWQTLFGHGVLLGNGYAAIIRNGRGVPLEMLLLLPDQTWPVRVDGELWYVTTIYRGNTSERIKIRPRDIYHLKGLGYDGLCGYPVLDILCDTFGGAIATRKHSTSFFKNGAMPGGVLETPGTLDPKSLEDLKKNWDRMHTGVDNSNKTAVLTQGMTFKSLSIDARKAQMLESRQFNNVEIALILGVKPHQLGDLTRQGYNSLEQEKRDFADEGLDPWWTTSEAEADDKLLTDEEMESDSHFFAWNRKASIQTDTKTEAEVIDIKLKSGRITLDEARGLDDMEEYPNELGKQFLIPTNNVTMIDITKPMSEQIVAEEPEPEPASKDDKPAKEAARAAVAESLRRMVTRIKHKAERAVDKNFIEFVDGIESAFSEEFDRATGPSVEVVRSLGGDASSVKSTFFKFVRDTLLKASECKQSELAASVGFAMLEAERACERLLSEVVYE